MGQKVNPHGLRVGVIKDWDSRWLVSDKAMGDTLVEDYNLRKYLKSSLYDAGIPKIEIERTNTKVTINIYCARPGNIIGQSGSQIEKTRAVCEQMVNKNRTEKLAVYINVVEVKQIDKNAQLVAENVAKQLENRVSYRRAMKQAIGRAMRFGAKGIKIQVSGRLAGAEIARTEHYHEGTIPLQTIRADIDYGFAEANTTYGKIGIKVWVYVGEVLGGMRNSTAPTPYTRAKKDSRPPRGDRPRNNSRPSGQREGGAR